MTPPEGGYPWVWLMSEALRLGVGLEGFWELSPRAILLLRGERRRALGAGGKSGKGQRTDPGPAQPLSRLPRP